MKTGAPSRPTLIVADNQQILLDGLRSMLSSRFDVVATATESFSLLESVEALAPKLVIVDPSLGSLSEIDLIRGLAAQSPAPRILVLTANAQPVFAAALLRFGASAFLLKDASIEELLRALEEVLKGGVYVTASLADEVAAQLTRGLETTADALPRLTARQRVVVQLIVDGNSVKRIADKLGLSRRTVECHKYQAMRRLGVTNTAALIREAVFVGLARLQLPLTAAGEKRESA
jgi:two-component system response regulator NreC